MKTLMLQNEIYTALRYASNKDVAAVCGVKPSQVSAWSTGTSSISLPSAQRIAKRLGVPYSIVVDAFAARREDYEMSKNIGSKLRVFIQCQRRSG